LKWSKLNLGLRCRALFDMTDIGRRFEMVETEPGPALARII
jgi:hypothetical protein